MFFRRPGQPKCTDCTLKT
ncbi:MAG: (2Fe-2S)-binding protein [Brevundimonas sp.]